MSDKHVRIPVTKSLSLDIEDIVGELRLSQSVADELAAFMDGGFEIRLSMCVEKRTGGTRLRCVSFSPVTVEMAGR